MFRRTTPEKTSPAAPATDPTSATAPRAGAAGTLLRLQGTIGNQAVLRLLADPTGGGRPAALPTDVRQDAEARSGVDLDDVVVHHDSPRPATIGAEAYAFGNDIHLGPGRAEHLPHETWHVVQQRQGRVAGTPTAAGVPVNTDPALERDADHGGTSGAGTSGSAPVLQGQFGPNDLFKLQQMKPDERVDFLVGVSDADWSDFLPYAEVALSSVEEHDHILFLRQQRAQATGADRGAAYDDDDEMAGGAYPAAATYEDDEMAGGAYPAAATYEDDPMTGGPALQHGDEMDDSDAAYDTSTDDAGATGAAWPWQTAVDHIKFWVRPPAPDDDPMTGVTAELDDPGSVDVVMTEGWEHGVEVTDVHATLAMDVDEAGAYDHVRGTFWFSVRAPGSEAAPHQVGMDFEGPVSWAGPSDQALAAMDVDITPDGVARDVRYWQARDPHPEEDEEQEDELAGDEAGLDSDAEVDDDGSMALGPEDGSEDADPLVDDLVAAFENLRIPFRTDLDGQAEEHTVYLGSPESEHPEVIVQSHPKALQSILTTKAWLGNALSKPTLQTLASLAATANSAIGAFGQARTKANAQKIKQTLHTIAQTLAHAVYATANLPDTNLASSVGYKGSGADLEGHHVIARPLSLNSGSNVGSPPQADSRLMTAIRDRANAEDPKQGKSYKQMHLLNDNLFGPGELWNLTPGPAASNSQMERDIETPLKRAIVDRGLVLEFHAEVKYVTDPAGQSTVDVRANPDLFRFDHIKFSAARLMPDASGAWKPVAGSDPDLDAINKAKVPWQYGSLRPLTPKARIAPGTTAPQFVASRVPPSIATRIAAWLLTGPPPITGANKKEQLAVELNKFDGKGVGPLWKKFKASDVLW